MPIFLDRHDLPMDVTNEQLRDAHREDIKRQAEFDCNFITYWWDFSRKLAFCLVEAPNIEAVKKNHEEAHGGVPAQIIEVDPDLVKNFLGRIIDPRNDHLLEETNLDDSAVRTLMLIKIIRDPIDIHFDNNISQKKLNSPKIIRGFDIDHDRDLTILLNEKNIIKELIIKYEGGLVKNNAAYILASFKSPTFALHSAVNIHRRLKQEKSTYSYKFSLNRGIPVTDKDEIFEDTIKLNERFCNYINKDIIISRKVFSLINIESNKMISEYPYLHIVKPKEEEFLNNFINLLEDLWKDHNIKIEDFLKLLSLSKSELYRKLKTITGKSPNKFINDYRLNKALHLLNSQKLTIAEIAFKTGFSSPSYFTKCFQKAYHKKPSDFYSIS